MRFPIVQLEFTHALGPPAGRYTVRDDAPSGNGAAPAGSADVLTLVVDVALFALLFSALRRAYRSRRAQAEARPDG